MNCRRFNKHVVRYLDGELTGRRHLAAERHIAVCAICAGNLKGLERLGGELAAYDIKSPPTGLVTSIMEALPARPEPRPSTSWLLWPAAIAASVGAVALGLLAGTATVSRPSSPTLVRDSVADAPAESMLNEAFALLPGDDETLALLALDDTGGME